MISRMRWCAVTTICLLNVLASSVWAQEDGVVVLSDTVTGNQEQPKVLYIVPWRAAEDDTILYQAVDTTLDEDVFNHVERVEHRRELDFLEQLGSGTSAGKSGN